MIDPLSFTAGAVAGGSLGFLLVDQAWQSAGLDGPPHAEIAACHRRALALEAFAEHLRKGTRA